MSHHLTNKGFTLLEIMVTVSILAIVLVSIFDLHSQTIALNIDAKFYATAPFLAQQKMAELAMGELSDIAEGSGDFGDDFPGFIWNVNSEDMPSDAFTTSGIYFKKITIAVSYNNGELTYDLQTYRMGFQNQ